VQAELAQQRHVGIGGGILRGEKFIAVKDAVRPGEEAERLAFPR